MLISSGELCTAFDDDSVANLYEHAISQLHDETKFSEDTIDSGVSASCPWCIPSSTATIACSAHDVE